MDITTILGLIVGVVAIVGAMIFKHISFSVFLNPAAFCVIILGTIATVLNSFPMDSIKNIGALFKILFTNRKGMTEVEIINLMVDLSTLTRKEGLLALESRMEEIEDPFIKKGLRMVVDGMDQEIISDIMESEIAAMEARHESNASIFSSAGTYAPTLGVMGAVFGLIAAMAHIDDVNMMAEAIAAAFIATILGIFTGYVLWNPFAKKLKVKSHEEALVRSMAVEGVLSLQKGDSPVIMKEKLLSVLPQAKQDKIVEEMNQG